MLLDACLVQIERRGIGVRAWQWIDAATTRRQAEQADSVLAQAVNTGPLHGVPIGIKDIIDTKGIPMGTPVYQGNVPERSASVVEMFEAGGAIVMGKTVTAELAFLSPGKTRNPWNPAHTPGGSSSGSAAAVAAGFVSLALGTQPTAR
ncbi:MAG: amidase family protein [Burkholderiales bacterium]